MTRIELPSMSTEVLDRVLALMHEITGITMPRSKQALVEGRLRARVRSLGLASYDAYADHLARNHAERQVFTNLVTTHQTGFFRTRRIWDYIRDVFLPVARAARRPGPLRVWSAAASTGEEACSLAMCCEEVRREDPSFRYEIVATDISTDVLEIAARGEYQGRAVAELRAAYPELFARYNAAPGDDRFSLAPGLRRRVTFSPHDLFVPYPRAAHFDLILLRNVLIYFSPADRTRAVRTVGSALAATGRLILGESESLTGHDVPFHFVEPQVYAKAPP